MLLTRLELRDFRNFAHQAVDLGPGLSVFWGDNGQGKTNLLEAVYLLATLKSFRGSKNRELVRKGAEAARVDGRIVAAGLPRQCSLAIDKGGKKVRVDGKRPRSLPDYFSGIKAISFVPGDLRLVDGAPERRREFLDRSAFTLDPGYLEVARAYQAALKQKNALLRDAKLRRRSVDRVMLGVWNERLVEAGAKMVERRVDFLREFAPVFRELHGNITSAAKGRPELRYRGCVKSEDLAGGLAGIRDALQAKVDAAFDSEASRGYALVGPQRDDWELQVGGEALRTFGSQGQLRSAALALRLAQLVTTRKRTGVVPLFLLDDVGSELDPHRNRALLELLGELEAQVLVTTTTLDNLRLEPGSFRSFRVQEGTISAE